MQTILVTGGAGFIGSHLCETLLLDGAEVICLDNFNDYYSPQLKEDNILGCLQSPKFSLVRGDIRSRKTLASIFDQNQINHVVHLAARAGVIPSVQNPIETFESNVIGTQNILDACRENEVSRITLASSSSVYGSREDGPFKETDNVSAPESPYGATKVMNEVMAHAYHVAFDLNITCMRFFTVYGPRQRPDMAIHYFVKQIITAGKVSVYGNPKTSRDYTYIDDIIRGIIGCMNLNEGYHILNLGFGKPVFLGDLVGTILDVMDIDAEVEWFPGRIGDVPTTHSDGSRAKELIKFEPRIGIREGIKRFLEWYKLKFGIQES